MRQDTRKALNQTADFAARALHFLIADGKLAIRDVTTALSRRRKLIKQLKDRFTALETEGIAATAKAKARKAAPRKAATRKAAPRKAAPRKAVSGKPAGRPRKTAARKAVRAKATKAAVATPKRKVARSSRKRASAPKATVKARTKKPAQIVVTAGAAEPTPRPVAVTENVAQPGAPSPKTTTRKLPKVANPVHEGTRSGPRDLSQT